MSYQHVETVSSFDYHGNNASVVDDGTCSSTSVSAPAKEPHSLVHAALTMQHARIELLEVQNKSLTE